MARIQVDADVLARLLMPGLDVTIAGSSAAFDFVNNAVVFRIEGPAVPKGSDWCRVILRTDEQGAVTAHLERGK